jgi:hypothetical protein
MVPEMSLLASNSLGDTEKVTEGWLYRPKITEPAFRSVLQRPEYKKRHNVANSTNTTFLCDELFSRGYQFNAES